MYTRSNSIFKYQINCTVHVHEPEPCSELNLVSDCIYVHNNHHKHKTITKSVTYSILFHMRNDFLFLHVFPIHCHSSSISREIYFTYYSRFIALKESLDENTIALNKTLV